MARHSKSLMTYDLFLQSKVSANTWYVCNGSGIFSLLLHIQAFGHSPSCRSWNFCVNRQAHWHLDMWRCSLMLSRPQTVFGNNLKEELTFIYIQSLLRIMRSSWYLTQISGKCWITKETLWLSNSRLQSRINNRHQSMRPNLEPSRLCHLFQVANADHENGSSLFECDHISWCNVHSFQRSSICSSRVMCKENTIAKPP